MKHLLRGGGTCLLLSFLLTISAGAQDEPDRNDALLARLEEKTLDVQFLSTPVDQAISYLSRKVEEPIMIDPAVYDSLPAISFRAEGISARRALRWMTYLAGLDYRVDNGVVVVASAEAIARKSMRMEVFDLRDLLQEIPDFIPASDSQVFDEQRAGLNADMLVSMVEELFDGWDDGATIHVERNILFVEQTPERLEAIAAYLDGLRGKLSLQVAVDFFLVEASSRFWNERLATGDGEPIEILDEEEFAALRPRLAAVGEGARIVSVHRAVGMSGQRVHALESSQRNIIADVDVSIAQGSVMADPIVGSVRSGTLFDIRPTPSADGSWVALDLRAEVWREMPGSSIDFPAVEEGEDPVRIVLPRSVGFLHETAIRIPSAGAYLATFVDPPEGGTPGSRLVLVVHPQVSSSQEGK